MRKSCLSVLRECAACVVLAAFLSFEKAEAVESSNATDYSVASHWMSAPATNKAVDVFYLYAPFYRQASLTPNDPVYVAGIPTTDGTAAFDYYTKNYNNGRPFILAGHSQGANTLANLLSGYLKTNSTVLARMIAAYVIGYPVTTEYLSNNPHLKFVSGSNDTGVIISYNTEAPGVNPADIRRRI